MNKHMVLTRKVQEIRKSRVIALPAQICDMLGIAKGDTLGIELRENKIVMVQVTQPPSQGTYTASTPMREVPA